MNSLQLELDSINSQLELLTYRKSQLDSIMSEYSDVINRVKSLVLSMEDANVEPVNLLIEIEGLIHSPEFEAVEPTPELITQPEHKPVAIPKLKPDDIIQHKNNELWHGRQFRVKGIKGFEVLCAWESNTGDVAYSFPADAVQLVHPEPTPEPTPEPIRLMALVPIKYSTESPAVNLPVKLNSHAYRRNDTLLIGFSNKRLMNQWIKWIKDNWGDRVNTTVDVDNKPSKGFPFPHCLSILWYGTERLVDWERLAKLNYAFKPDEQPTGIKLDDVRNIILNFQSNGLKFISKGELLAHHLNSLKASELEDYLGKLADEGLIALGNKSIDLLPSGVGTGEQVNL